MAVFVATPPFARIRLLQRQIIVSQEFTNVGGAVPVGNQSHGLRASSENQAHSCSCAFRVRWRLSARPGSSLTMYIKERILLKIVFPRTHKCSPRS